MECCKKEPCCKDRLVQRHITQDASCQLCGEERKTILHSLLHCDAAKQIWALSAYVSDLAGASSTLFADFWVWLCSKFNAEAVSTMGTFLWAAWRCRNLEIVENDRPNPTMLAAGFLSSCMSIITVWRCPPQGCVKVNTDAHCPAGGLAGLGTVIRDANGSLLTVATRTHTTSPECAEALAVRYALQLARRLGFSRVWVESDAINVVKAVHIDDGGKAPIHLIFDDIRKDSLPFELCTFSHVKRSCNTVAHLAARWDTGCNVENVFLSPFPQILITLADLDMI
ncbi:uncharacterized protein LOC110687544 [Chenopodium quinoa]|uniref:uncharacterized protein LOC110687544 n=1 Tax=Chenopodium quinoa TaxID=63459 RepID=UPI000B78C78B|nr:uncharacterized protein LOC110687544 [Chenopodium quinoa]